jgi:hypothetical protein
LSFGHRRIKREIQRLKVLQTNLHNDRAASVALCVAMKNCDVALIQDPWKYKGEINILKEVSGELIYGTSIQHPRTCILLKKSFQLLPLMHRCSRDLTAVKIKTSSDGGRERLFSDRPTFHMIMLNLHLPWSRRGW